MAAAQLESSVEVGKGAPSAGSPPSGACLLPLTPPSLLPGASFPSPDRVISTTFLSSCGLLDSASASLGVSPTRPLYIALAHSEFQTQVAARM